MPNSPDSLRLHNLLKTGRRHAFSKGQVIQSSDGRLSLSLVEEGYIKRYQVANDGSMGIHGIYGPGNFFPLTLAYELLFNPAQELYSGPETFYYEAMTDVVTYVIDNQTLSSSIKNDPLLYRGLLLEAGKRLHFYIQRLENSTLKISYKRLAHQLVFYAKEFGRQGRGNETEILLPLTHQTLAEVLNLTRETISQSISTLRRKKLIRTGTNIVVLDVQKLDEIARS